MCNKNFTIKIILFYLILISNYAFSQNFSAKVFVGSFNVNPGNNFSEAIFLKDSIERPLRRIEIKGKLVRKLLNHALRRNNGEIASQFGINVDILIQIFKKDTHSSPRLRRGFLYIAVCNGSSHSPVIRCVKAGLRVSSYGTI